MATKDIQLEVITPERSVLKDATDSVVIPAHDGELGILRNRASLMCELGVGPLRYQKEGRARRVLIDGGFAQVHANKVTVLTPRAVLAEEITDSLIAKESAAAEAQPAQTAEQRAARTRAHKRVSVMRRLRES